MRAEGQGARDPPARDAPAHDPPAVQRPDLLHLRIAADPLSVRGALAQVMLWASAHLGAEEERGAVEIVLAEVLNNIVEHAYPQKVPIGARLEPSIGASGESLGATRPHPRIMGHRSGDEVRLSLRVTAAGLTCLVEDTGAALQGGLPSAAVPPDPEGLPEGGFGWPLIRALCRDLRYERAGGTNRLRFTLPLGQSGEWDVIV